MLRDRRAACLLEHGTRGSVRLCGRADNIALYGCNPANGGKCCKAAGAWPGCMPCPANAPTPSSLYGCGGELWDARSSRLSDWSRAGYASGEHNPPRLPHLADVRVAFGAKGDGVTDDTAAFELAFATVGSEGVIHVPTGTFVIGRRLDINKRIVLQGDGPGRSVLLFPRPLRDVSSDAASTYAYGPCFLNFNGGDFPDTRNRLARIVTRAERGLTMLEVDSTAQLLPGKVVRLVMDNPGGRLLQELNANLLSPTSMYNDRTDVLRWASRITAVHTEQWPPRVELERALPFPVDPAWAPELHEWVTDRLGMRRNTTGIADLTLRFSPAQPFAGEGREVGHNAVYFSAVAHSWVRNVVIENAELGIVLDGGAFNTIENVTFSSSRIAPASSGSTTTAITGTRGIWLKNEADSVVSNFCFASAFAYEITLGGFAHGNVIANGRCVDGTLELAYGAAYGNLFTNIHLGTGSKPFGWVERGQDASGRNVFWNVRTSNDSLVLPPASWAPAATFVHAEAAAAPRGAAGMGWYVESRTDVWPYDLWSSMRTARGRPLPLPQPTRARGPGYGCLKNNTRCCNNAPTTNCAKCPPDASQPSSLWGCTGELWSARGRLSYDWGYAGYRHSTAPPPSHPATSDLREDFGAAGDGVTDDTDALLHALDVLHSGSVLFMPAGRYLLTAVINIRKNVTLRGAGRGSTVLYFPHSLSEIYGSAWLEGGVSAYSHGTGFINVGGWDPTGRNFTLVARVTQNALRGERVLRLASTEAIVVGRWYRLLQRDPGDGSLMSELHGNSPSYSPPAKHRGYADPCRFLTRVLEKGPDWVRTERAVPFRVDTRWSPELHRYVPLLSESIGLEHFTLEFPWTPYPGHFLEAGYNGIHFNQVAHGWLRGLSILNSDSAIYLWGCTFVSVEDLLLDVSQSRGAYDGHRGVWLEHGSDTLVKNFTIAAKFVHDLSVSATEHGSVFMSGSGRDLNLDHHRLAPYANLYTNLTVGLGSRVFASGGNSAWGPHTAAGATFHNIRGAMRFALPAPEFGPGANMLGLATEDPADYPSLGWHVEPQARPHPINLFAEMARTRGWRNPA